MPHAEAELQSLSESVREFSLSLLREKRLTHSLEIDSIILYGGAARFQFGISPTFRDYDLNLFFRRLAGYDTGDAKHFNRLGGYWKCGQFQHKDVQVLFNVLSQGETRFQSAHARTSDRWNRIRNAPVLLLHPGRHDYRQL